VRREAEAKAHLEEAKRDLDLYYVDEVLDDEDVFQMIVEKGFQPTSEDALAAAVIDRPRSREGVPSPARSVVTCGWWVVRNSANGRRSLTRDSTERVRSTLARVCR
jgi:hypothetical protein